MPQIGIADKTTQDSMNIKVGTNTDASGTTTLFARLKQIYDYLTTNLSVTRATKIDNLDATISTRATATSVSTIDTKVGTANPSTGGTDTLFKYLKNISDQISSNIIQPTKPRSVDARFVNATQNTWYTVVDISGAGILSRLSIILEIMWSNTLTQYEITIDGVAVTENTRSADFFSRGISMPTSSNPRMGAADYLFNVAFKTSLKIRVRSLESTARTLNVSADYALV